MIRRLRVWHRVIFVSLALVLPVVFIAGLLARRHQLPKMAAQKTDAAGFRLLEKTGLRVRVSNGFIELMAASPLAVPDPLLYWSPNDSMTDGATLLGPLEGMSIRRFSLPKSGYLLVYSLGRREVVASDRIELPEGRQ